MQTGGIALKLHRLGISESSTKLKNLDVNMYDLKTTKIHTCRKKGATAHSFVKVSCIFCMTLHNFDEILVKRRQLELRTQMVDHMHHAHVQCAVFIY